MESAGYLVLRLVFGMIFVMHGCQHTIKGFGGGKGLEGSEATAARIGFRPAWLWGCFLGFGMLGGGLMLTFGAFTPIGAAMVITTMTVAVITNKLSKGFWNKNHGYEYNLSLIGGSAAAGLIGPGPNSIDAVLMPSLVSPQLFVISLVVFLGIAFMGFITRQPAEEPVRE